MKPNSFHSHRIFVSLLSIGLSLPLGVFAGSLGDDFNDNSKDTDKWGTDAVSGFGVLTETGQQLRYTCNNALSESDANRPWTLEKFPYNSDWEIQIDTVNSTAPSQALEVTSNGIDLFSPNNADSDLYLELYASPFGAPTNKGFDANLNNNGNNEGNTDTGQLAGTEEVKGAVRMTFNSTTKVVTCYYDADTTDGYQWTELASYGLAGSGGTNANTDWGLTDSDQFTLYVYGYSRAITVTSGEVYLDNFSESGGAPSNGGPTPVPTGNFTFAFPTNNPLLVAIANISGNYTGISTDGSSRPYDLDVAQDESGKLVTMGTVEGIEDGQGGTDLSAPVGAVTTVNNEPTLGLKGSFAGTVDGNPATCKGSASGPVEITDIGGGTNGVAVTGSAAVKVDGVPVTFQNTPVLIPSTPSMETNFKKSWNFNLDISQKTIKGKPATVATLQLMLPSGDIIEYPERVVKYSTTKGYKLSFKGGMNTTQNPATIDKKSKITITGLLFEKQGDEWVPTGGTVLYQFHGQKGGANLLDFDMP